MKDLFGELLHSSKAPAKARRRDELTFRGNVQRGRHGWLRLTPAYSLHVVNGILSSCNKRDLVLDPFSGTGTTPLASAVMGIPAYSVDINPFLVWLGNVKLGAYATDSAVVLREAARAVVSAAKSQSHDDPCWVPDLHQIEKWWDRPVLRGLIDLSTSMQAYAGSADTLDLLKVAFCRVLIQTANVSFGHQSMSFKKSIAPPDAPLFGGDDGAAATNRVYDAFSFAVDEIAQSLDAETPLANAQVVLGDSRDLKAVLPRRDYTRVVTSPPYPNRMSYIRELRPYMYWLGFLASGREAGEMDWKAIGGTWGCATSNLNSWQPPPTSPIPYAAFDNIVADISARQHLLGRYVHRYFVDIHAHLLELKHVLAPGAKCYYVVGNSKFYDTMLPVEEIYAAIFDKLGYGNVRIDRLRKRTSKKELYEFMVCADKPTKNSD